MKDIGFIGLGNMGSRMASNLIKKGMNVTVFDLSKPAVQKLEGEGAIAAKSITELAKNQDAIITMVQTGDQVKDICMGNDGIFAVMKEGSLLVDCSSIDIVNTKELHKYANDAGLNMLDAPVSGGVAGAESGTLTIMVGGEQKVFNSAMPIFEMIGKKIIYAGQPGSGQAAKICNNMLLAISMIGVSEAFVLAKKLGLEEKKFFEISSNASGQCWSMTSYCPVADIIENVPSNNDYKPGFMAKMMLKDLRLAQHAAESVEAVIPLGGISTELYELFINQGYGEMDFSGIIKMLDGKMS